MTPQEFASLFAKLRDDDILYCTAYGKTHAEDDILEWRKREIIYKPNDQSCNDRFAVIWGWPGPDYNIYKLSDYGKTWAFKMKDFK